MAQVETLHLPTLVVCFSNHLFGDVKGGEGEEAYVEFEGHGQDGGNIIFEVIFMVGIST